MTEPMTSTASTLVNELVARHQEPQWLAEWRHAAWERYVNMTVPRLEKTDLRGRSWDFGPFPAAAPTDGAPAAAAPLVNELHGAPGVYVQDGVVIRIELPDELSKQGVVLTDLHTAAARYPELVQRHLGALVPADENRWCALNAALWHGGVFLYVPRRVQVEQVISIVHADTEQGRGAMPRILVVAEEQAAVSLIEVYAGSENRGEFVHSAVTEVVAQPAARVTVGSLTQFVKGPTHFFTRRARVAKDASVDWVCGDVGDGFAVGLVESRLDGDGSRSTVLGFGVGYGRQHLDLTASMIHGGRHSESDIRLFGVLRQRANSVFRSSTHMLRGAVGAGSEQHDRVLMLDSTARADAIPMLLIDENDVSRCAHAASVGKIDPTQVYYLMSRGIPEKAAAQMIIWGYLQPIVDALPSEPVREWVTTALERKLTG